MDKEGAALFQRLNHDMLMVILCWKRRHSIEFAAQQLAGELKTKPIYRLFIIFWNSNLMKRIASSQANSAVPFTYSITQLLISCEDMVMVVTTHS